MISQPNIPFADVKRLSIDDTAPVPFRFWSGTTALDLTGKTFRLVLYAAGSTTVALTVEDGSLLRAEGASAGLLVWNADANRDTLTSTGLYTGYLFEIIGGKREPRCWIRFQWLTEPPAYVVGLPVEPPEIALSYGALPIASDSVSVYDMAAPAFESVDAARSAPLPKAKPLFITINGKAGYKDADDVYYLVLSPA